MARIEFYSYQRLCHEKIKRYFPGGLRSGLVALCYGEDGTLGIGEYAPLKGLIEPDVKETLLLIKRQNKKSFIRALGFPNDCEEHLPYPLSWMMSMAFFHKQIKNSSLQDEKIISLSGLVLACNIDDTLKEIERLFNLGFRCFKIKISSLPLPQEIEKINKINGFIKGRASIRLDANKRFSLADADIFLKGIGECSFDYIEEPLSSSHLVPKLLKKYPVAVACDESYDLKQPLYSIKQLGISHLVIKPSRFTSIFELLKTCGYARDMGIKPVLSTCFESDFFAAVMAFLVDDLDLTYAHGLYVPNIFCDINYEHRLPINIGSLSLLKSRAYLDNFKLEGLGEIKHELTIVA